MEPPHPHPHLSPLSTLHGLALTASLSHLSPHLVSHHSQSLTASPCHSLGLTLISSSSRSRAPAFASSAEETDGTSQAASAPLDDGVGRRLLVSSRSWKFGTS
ncbi:hypothetical protein AHAS_Ahas05G0223200 [Arachis hypogaea]